MVLAFFRLILIAATTAFVFVAVGYGLRSLGEQQQYSATPKPLIDHRPVYVAWGGLAGDYPLFSLKSYREASDKHWLLGLDLRLSRDGVWYIYPDKYLKDGSFLTHANSADLDKSKPPILRFSTLLKVLPLANYYVIVENPAVQYLEQVFKAIEDNHLEEHFILSSPFADTTNLIRDRNPRWLTGSTTSEVAKAELLSALYLEPLVTTTGDVVTLDKVNRRLMAEFRKRHLGVLLKSDNATEIKDLLQEDLISGAVTSRLFLTH
jgi:hypothetical protein